MYALGFYAPHAGAGVRYGATMAMHLIVDRVTAVHGTKGETTIRGRDQSVNPFIFYMRRAYASYQVTCSQTPRTCTILCDFAVSAHNVACAPPICIHQFLAVASHLTPSPRAMDLGYNTISESARFTRAPAPQLSASHHILFSQSGPKPAPTQSPSRVQPFS